MQWAELTAQEGFDGAGVTDGSVSNTIGGEGNMWSLGGRAWSVAGELHFTWEHTNLRLGVEYGHYTVPVANVVVPRRGYLPVFDIYWRI